MERKVRGGFRGDLNCHDISGEIVWKSEMIGFRGRSQGCGNDGIFLDEMQGKRT